jgi:hypothetical protein
VMQYRKCGLDCEAPAMKSALQRVWDEMSKQCALVSLCVLEE